MKKITLLLMILILLTACLFAKNDKKYSMDEKIGQMLMFGFKGTAVNDEWIQTLNNQVKKLKLGGILVINYNVKSPEQMDSLMTFLHQTKPAIPLLFAIDQEGGKVQRLSKRKGFTDYLPAQTVADSLSPEQAYAHYNRLALECKKYGFNYILGPVVDVNINPTSPAIGAIKRSYSSDPAIVTKYASVFMKAVSDNGMLSCLKHFPGHGSAANDSHLGLTDVTKTWGSSELDPYRQLIKKNNIHSVMSSHIYNAAIDSLYPASLSPNFIEKKLRKELNYNGVVISDDLQMGAISNYYSLEEIVIQSVNAGNDILIFSQYFNPDIKLPEKVVQIIKDAVKSGKISEQRINESFERIVKLKKNLD